MLATSLHIDKAVNSLAATWFVYHAVSCYRHFRRLHFYQDRIELFLHFAYLFRLVDLLIVLDLGQQFLHSLDLCQFRLAVILLELIAQLINLQILILVFLLNLFG